MVASMNHTIQSEVTIPLRDVDPENDLSDPTSEQRTPFGNEGAGRNEQNVGRCKLKLSKKDFIIAILSVSFVISVGFNIFQHAQRKQVEAQTKQLEAMSTPKPFLTSSCPQGWIRNEESCYFFSDVESTWDLSHSNCSSYNASLLVMATPQEKAFIIENKAFAEYWLGHRRQDTREPWKDVWFVIKGDGLCASLNADVVSSTDCDSHRRWICCKDAHAV